MSKAYPILAEDVIIDYAAETLGVEMSCFFLANEIEI